MIDCSACMEKQTPTGRPKQQGVIARVSIQLQIDAKAPQHRGAPKLHPVLPSGSDLVGQDFLDFFRRAVAYTDKILKGPSLPIFPSSTRPKAHSPNPRDVQ
jgi:hypothetical protein